MTRPAKMPSFQIDKAEAYWVTCKVCGETELFFGESLQVEALDWATKHAKECAGPTPQPSSSEKTDE